MPVPQKLRTRPVVRSVAIGLAVLASVPALAVAASAHVAVTSPDAVRGGELALVSFRVPTESEKASTVKVTITLPEDEPVARVAVRPIPGWTAVVTDRKLSSPTKVGDFTLTSVPSTITWTAASGSGVKPGEFQSFDITIAPVPDVDVMTFSATQTYSDGTVVQWNQEPAADGSEAEFPHPELVLAAGEPGASPSASPTESASPSVTVTATPVAAPSDSSSSSGTVALVASVVAVVLGAAALVVALRRGSTTT